MNDIIDPLDNKPLSKVHSVNVKLMERVKKPPEHIGPNAGPPAAHSYVQRSSSVKLSHFILKYY